MRRLIYIPIVHSDADMGSMSESLKDVYMKHHGRRKWTQRTRIVAKMWKEIEKKISLLPLDYAKVKIYQDGLPKCGRELEIAKSAAAGGSENYQLVLDLVEKGAQLIGTEDPNLLIQEYHQLRNTLDNLQGKSHLPPKEKLPRSRSALMSRRSAGFGAESSPDRLEGFVSQRDKYIALRIDQTLRDGETGFLFVGVVHRVNEMLPSDIQISYLLPL